MNAHHKTQQSRKRPRDPITKEYRRSGSDLRDASLARSIARIPFGEEVRRPSPSCSMLMQLGYSSIL